MFLSICLNNRNNTVEIDPETFLKNNLNSLNLSLYQAAFFDLSKLIYSKNLDKIEVSLVLRKFGILLQKNHFPVIALVRSDLLNNEHLYLISKAVIISDIKYNDRTEERFADSNIIYVTSILSKSGSGKLEIDDNFEFYLAGGFRRKKIESLNLLSNVQASISILNNFENHCKTSVAMIVVEDSDRDSEDEMTADLNF